MATTTPNVFEHTDFRWCLEDWFMARRAQHPRNGHRAFA
jgi:hypothetical protein